jgi:hypothetical protein
MKDMSKASKKRIGSKLGSILLKVKKVKGGFSMKAKAEPMELLNIAATIIDGLATDRQIDHQDVIEAVIEILYEGDETSWSDLQLK